jgi:hypothetical protein
MQVHIVTMVNVKFVALGQPIRVSVHIASTHYRKRRLDDLLKVIDEQSEGKDSKRCTKKSCLD